MQAGLGYTIVPESVASQCPPDIHHQIIADSDVDIETIGVALRKPSPIVRKFMSILRSEFAGSNER